MLWEQQDQQAYTHFPQKLTQTELLPYINKNEHRNLQYRDPTLFNTTNFEQINMDHNFITDYSETSTDILAPKQENWFNKYFGYISYIGLVMIK